MKGVSLGPNLLVIIALAIILLIAITSLLMTQWGSGSQTIDVQSEKSRACNLLVTGRCLADTDSISVNIDVGNDGDTTNDNLLGLCESMGLDDTGCRASCGC